MDMNDFIGSFAQENVTFKTQIVRGAAVGDNFMKTCIFTTEKNLTADGVAGLVAIPGSEDYKAITVTANDFATYTAGLLQSWLVDLYSSGSVYDTIIVSLGDGTSLPTVEQLAAAYELIKPYAYHKTLCIGNSVENAAPTTASQLNLELIQKLVELCTVDKQLLSSPVLLPYSTATPETPNSDVIYTAVKDTYVFMSCHADATRNAALFSLGLALSSLNGSGYPIGNSMDMIKTTNITASGPDGTNLGKSVRDALESLNIQTFKPIGNNTGAVAAVGDLTLNGDAYGAEWILSFITYMVKVRVAEMITVPNFYKNETNYTRIIEVLISYVNLFGPQGAGRLIDTQITAPSYSKAAALGDSKRIVIPGAWIATYRSSARNVDITGTLYIEA